MWVLPREFYLLLKYTNTDQNRLVFYNYLWTKVIPIKKGNDGNEILISELLYCNGKTITLNKMMKEGLIMK